MSWQFPPLFKQPGAAELQVATTEASIFSTLHYDLQAKVSLQWTESSPAPRAFEVGARQPAGSSQVTTCIAVHHRNFQLKPSTLIESLIFWAHVPLCFKVDHIVHGCVDLLDAYIVGRRPLH